MNSPSDEEIDVPVNMQIVLNEVIESEPGQPAQPGQTEKAIQPQPVSKKKRKPRKITDKVLEGIERAKISRKKRFFETKAALSELQTLQQKMAELELENQQYKKRLEVQMINTSRPKNVFGLSFEELPNKRFFP
jgi:hypothetical protein